jgi:hypothetical protein
VKKTLKAKSSNLKYFHYKSLNQRADKKAGERAGKQMVPLGIKREKKLKIKKCGTLRGSILYIHNKKVH